MPRVTWTRWGRCWPPTTSTTACCPVISPTATVTCRQWLYHAAYSNIRYIIEKQLAEGDEVVTSFSARLTHDRAETAGFAPTGKEYEMIHIFIHRIAGGKIAEEMGAGTGLQERMEERLEQEIRERERVEQELH